MRVFFLAALLVAACDPSTTMSDGGDAEPLDASVLEFGPSDATVVDADALDADALDAGALDAECLPLPVGHDCHCSPPPPPATCTTACNCLGDAGPGGTCVTGGACVIDTDCHCTGQRCVRNICWY